MVAVALLMLLLMWDQSMGDGVSAGCLTVCALLCSPQSVWVKKGTMQWWRDWKPHKWVDVRFALEQFSNTDGNKDGILFIYYTFNEEKKVIV